ncbi:MAG: ABC transporter ATP-binding protein [Gammaproteobacteria bacterium]|nr:MAG: ABC transporter ATP-binding protein [Gammaproteobacteria bacterium]
MKALEIKNLNKIYDNNLIALDNVSLNVDKGDFYALLGPNGAGKSTMIGIISSLVNKSSGSVKILGLDIDTHHSEAKKKIGIVGQEVNFNQFETVHNVLLHQAGFFGLPYKDVKTNTEFFLKRLNLWDKRNEQGRNLSGGMKRRLMVAKALVNKPELLILDEPTAGVDTELRRSLWDFLIEINKNGTTIILTTHYLEEAERLCKNISIIDHGKIVRNSDMNSFLREVEIETFIFDLKDKLFEMPLSNNFKIIKIDDSTLSVQANKGISLNTIFNFFNENNIEILSMRNETNRLEELFLELTNNDY